MLRIEQNCFTQTKEAIVGNVQMTPEQKDWNDATAKILRDYTAPGLGEHSLIESVFCAINSNLRKFNLTKTHDLYEVFNEVYIRGVKKTKEGERILNPQAWIRTTAYNVIREWSRKSQTQTKNEIGYDAVSTVPLLASQPCLQTPEELHAETEKLLRGICSDMNDLDVKLLILSIIDDVEMKEAADHLSGTENVEFKSDALRKRKQRALNSLKKRLLEGGDDYISSYHRFNPQH
jgi:DNA-directed RNA polymerase specialized sigma24 family protein